MSWSSYLGKCFQSSTIKNDVSCGLVTDTLYEVEEVPFHSWFITGFIMKGCWIQLNAFSTYTKIIFEMCFCPSINLAIMLTGFCMVTYSCSPGINPTWMVHNPFYMLLIQFCSILLKIFASIFYYLEKEMATHSSVPAWKIPWMGEPGRLQSMGSQRVAHSWVTSLSFFL